MKAPSDKHFIHGSIFWLSNKLQVAGDKQIEGLTTKQWFLLLFVDGIEGEMPTITEIAKEMNTSRQNTAKLLEQLRKKGFVKIVGNPYDWRSQGVVVTEEGRVSLGKVSAIGESFIEQLFIGVSEEDITSVVRVFKQLYKNLDQIGSRTGSGVKEN